MFEAYEKVIEALGSNKYFGNVHVLETADEGLCSFYFIELKPKYPPKKDEQIAVLWELLEKSESPEEYQHKSGNELNEALRVNFQYILDNWAPRILERRDTERAKKLMLKCQSSFPHGATFNGWGTNRRVGYYKNNKYGGSVFHYEIAEKVIKANSGLVLYDDWNMLMLLIERKNVYSLFYWFTGA